MGVYNEEKYIKAAIESILGQTYTNFECLIINDGSKDNTVRLVKQFKDDRIRLIENDENIGLTKTLNKGIRLAKGKYIARMDADDVAFANRLRTQINFLENNSEIGICGSWVNVMGDEEGVIRWKLAQEHEEIKAILLFRNALHHPTVVFRKSVFEEVSNQYDPTILYGQDYELWTRLILKTKVHVLPQALLKYRLQSPSLNPEKIKYQIEVSKRIRCKYFESLLNRPLSDTEKAALAGNWNKKSLVLAWLNLSKELLQSGHLTKKGKLVFINNWLNVAAEILDAGFSLSLKSLAPYLFFSPTALNRKAKLFWKVLKNA